MADKDEVTFSFSKFKKGLGGGNGSCGIGSGCLVKIDQEQTPWLRVPEGIYLVTTAEIIGRLAQDGRLTAEFPVQKRKWQPLWLAGETQAFPISNIDCLSVDLAPINLRFIPVGNLLDPRGFFKRRFASVLQNAEPLRCCSQMADLQSDIDGGRLYCHILCDFQRGKLPFHFRPFQIGQDSSGSFFLQEPGSPTEPVRFMKDFSSEVFKPHGAAIVNQNGQYAGALGSSRDGKIALHWITDQAFQGNERVEQNGNQVNPLPVAEKVVNTNGLVTGFSNENKSTEPSENPPDLSIIETEICAKLAELDTNPPKDIDHPADASYTDVGPSDHKDQLFRQRSEVACSRSPKFPVRSFSLQEPIPIKPGILVTDAIIPNINAMDILAQGLDKSQRNWIKCYRHLAALLGIDQKTLLEIQTSSTNHPSERLFFYLQTILPHITFGEIKGKLRDLKRVDVIDTLDEMKIKDDEKLSEMTHDLRKVHLELEGKKPTWEDLGNSFEVDKLQLEKMKTSCVNPTSEVLRKASSEHASTTIGTLKKILKENLKRKDVYDILEKHFSDTDTIAALLDDLNTMDEVSFLLNKEQPGLKNWEHLAHEFNFKECEWLKSDHPPSPTQQVIECICSQNPLLTVEELFSAIAELGREDVLQNLKSQFKGEDIDRIVEKVRRQNADTR